MSILATSIKDNFYPVIISTYIRHPLPQFNKFHSSDLKLEHVNTQKKTSCLTNIFLFQEVHWRTIWVGTKTPTTTDVFYVRRSISTREMLRGTLMKFIFHVNVSSVICVRSGVRVRHGWETILGWHTKRGCSKISDKQF